MSDNSEQAPSLQEQIEHIVDVASDSVLPRIVGTGDPVLRTPAAPWVGQVPLTLLRELSAVMKRTMNAAPGVGLAAVQIGVNLSLAVIQDEYEISAEQRTTQSRPALPFFTMINPRYTAISDAQIPHFEGRLSLPGLQAVRYRASAIRVGYLDLDGTQVSRELQGWPARIAQHETDHLNGELYIDQAVLATLSTSEEFARHWAGQSPIIAEQRLAWRA